MAYLLPSTCNKMNTISMNTKLIILSIASASVLFTSCVKNDYYDTEPTTQPVGYQYRFDDDFNYDANNWSFADDNNAAYVDISGGLLHYSYNPANPGTNTVAIVTGANLRYDFLIQTRITSDNAMGVVFGVSNNNYGYSVMVDKDGYFAVYDEGNSTTPAKAILDWQYSTALRKGWNDIEVEQIGNYWTGYANGAKLFEIPAQYLTGQKIGYIVTAGTEGKADYLTVKW